MTMRKLPAYPLFVKDPYFSIWSADDIFNRNDTVFWHGEPKPICGTLLVDGKEFVFLGRKRGAIPLGQTSLEIKAFSTICTYTCEDFTLTAEYVSPLPPDDLELASCPVCYLRYELIPKRPLKSVAVKLTAEERLCYNTCFREERKEEVRSGVMKFERFESAYFGLRHQRPLSHSSDEIAADWGFYYLAAKDCACIESDGRNYICATDEYCDVRAPICGKILIAFDDLISIYYFGEPLKGFYFRNGKTISDALRESYANADAVFSSCERFDASLRKQAEPYGEDYLLMLYAALRQSVGAHKLVQDRKGRILFLSKECNSGGCISTVDVSYPSAPLYLLYAPELVNGMLYPILDFARMEAWEYDFAPHDAGLYPYCLGQMYGALNQENKYNPDIYIRDRYKPECMPMLYLFPKGSKLYALEKQMPVEECGNMLILAAAANLAGGNDKILHDNFDLFEKWVTYLCEYGLIPEYQLCTDDFALHLAGNANLSLKACFGIAAFAMICEKTGRSAMAKQYIEKARGHAEKWIELCFDGEHATPLVIGGGQDTYSLKYNLIFDKLFGTHFFPQSLYRAETQTYFERMERFGTPLDSRADYTKSDWLVWVATFCADRQEMKKLFAHIADYLQESPDRVPFADWYDTKTGANQLFRNRTVQGGIFMPLLLDSGKLMFSASLLSGNEGEKR